MSTTLSAGGGSSAASWAVHAACDNFRGTDPLVVGLSRRALAKELKHPDTSAGIPDARWTRAMIFERLCHDAAFAGEVTARATGWSGFPRPTSIYGADCASSPDKTRDELTEAKKRAVADGSATLLYKVAIPYPGFAQGEATNVLPDLVVVAASQHGPSAVVGDVKDYERVRSRIDDGRLLRGFLQVAMGAFALWADRPTALAVSTHGFLAVPRSAFLQPTVEVEDLTDHLTEVESQWRGRLTEWERSITPGTPLGEYVAHLHARFDPASCPSCPLFSHCRQELRASDAPDALLVELGVPENERASVSPMLHGQPTASDAKASTVGRVRATLTGRVSPSGALRLDPVGRPGVVNVVAGRATRPHSASTASA